MKKDIINNVGINNVGMMINVDANVKNVGEYLDYENCKCRKSLVVKLVEECNEIVEELKTLDKSENFL